MTRTWKIVALFLLLAGMLGSLTGQAATTLSVHEPPSGCHGHGKEAPVHAPSSTACCIAGHHAAIVPSSCMPQSLLPVSATILAISSQSPFPISTFGVQFVASGAPPGTQSLRI